MNELRLHRFLAQCGLGSRRACEELVARGEVAVDGMVVDRQGTKICPETQRVTVRGREVVSEPKQYLMLNKPRNVVTTCRDPQGRKTCMDLLPADRGRLFPVGRLDRDSEGLLLLTNDGDLAAELLHPRHEIPKVYQVLVDRALEPDEECRFIKGIEHRGDLLHASSIRAMDTASDGHEYEIVLREGRNRQIRRMFATCGVRVKRLRRVAIGGLRLGKLGIGAWRELTPDERTQVLAAHIMD